ncbi:hypothetical protein Tco_0466366 [Tanacetum coccineum]|uniref:Uncharacterized protein n=1 Tax=Tanacetum coccineum TaxID=301880 RepID=A0ABQ5F2W3_9ASTR
METISTKILLPEFWNSFLVTLVTNPKEDLKVSLQKWCSIRGSKAVNHDIEVKGHDGLLLITDSTKDVQPPVVQFLFVGLSSTKLPKKLEPWTISDSCDFTGITTCYALASFADRSSTDIRSGIAEDVFVNIVYEGEINPCVGKEAITLTWTKLQNYTADLQPYVRSHKIDVIDSGCDEDPEGGHPDSRSNCCTWEHSPLPLPNHEQYMPELGKNSNSVKLKTVDSSLKVEEGSTSQGYKVQSETIAWNSPIIWVLAQYSLYYKNSNGEGIIEPSVQSHEKFPWARPGFSDDSSGLLQKIARPYDHLLEKETPGSLLRLENPHQGKLENKESMCISSRNSWFYCSSRSKYPMVCRFCKLPCGEIRYQGNDIPTKKLILQGCSRLFLGIPPVKKLCFSLDQVIRRGGGVVFAGQEALDILKACHSGPTGGHYGAIRHSQKKISIQDSICPPSTRMPMNLVTVWDIVNVKGKITPT